MLPFPLQAFVIGFLGLVLSTLMILRGLSIKARLANIEFSPSKALKDDWYNPVITITALIMALIFLPYTKPDLSKLIILGFFALLGYAGSDLIYRLFSVANKKLNAAIDYKTTISDTQTGTLDTPTPAAPIKKDNV